MSCWRLITTTEGGSASAASCQRSRVEKGCVQHVWNIKWGLPSASWSSVLQGLWKGARLRSHPVFVVGLNQPGLDEGAEGDQHLWAPPHPSHPITAVGCVFLRRFLPGCRTPADVTDVVL